MYIQITRKDKVGSGTMLCVISGQASFPDMAWPLTESISKLIAQKPESWQKCIILREGNEAVSIITPHPETGNRAEHYRQMGALLCSEMKTHNFSQVFIAAENGADTLNIAEGLLLKSYSFQAYKSKRDTFTIKEIQLPSKLVSDTQTTEILSKARAVFVTRDLVNEPPNVLTAVELSRRVSEAGKQFGFEVEVLGKAKLTSLKMGGILSVNQGSTEEPTFSILRYSHPDAKNAKPIVLVGKGVVYDTGGYSLKPTPNSMDQMKSDMAGAAAVAGAFCTAAQMQLRVNLLGLIPASDNRIGPDAYSPGDVITMYDGTHVEVMNTDAEGRLLLADALTYAKQYGPELVIDLATLTGSSMHTTGYLASAVMGTAGEDIFTKLSSAAETCYERIIRLPLWDEYAADLDSDIADVKNLGSDPLAGAIKAGKFLQRFTDYPWIHLDIAGPAFLNSPRGYLPKGGTGYGVSLMYEFLKDLSK